MSERVFPWVVVGALRREIIPIRKLCRRELIFLEAGMGCENTERSLRKFIRDQPVAAVLGIGLAGALSPFLEIGDLVIGQEIRGPSLITPPAALAKAAYQLLLGGLRVHLGTLITRNQMICTAEGKSQIAASLTADRVGCIDMESWAIARVCQESGIPYVIVRCISDVWNEDLPLNFNLFCLPDGNLDDHRIVISALMHPSCIWGLWELRRHVTLCTRRLAKFVEQFATFDPTTMPKG
jgi:adenosylhomocysteine nucleosidase